MSAALAFAASLLVLAAARPAPGPQAFKTPEDAARALVKTVRGGDLEKLIALFGAHGQELVDTSDPATGHRNREVFVAAAVEGWRLADAGAGRKELVLGNEAWPFPVPIVKGPAGWSFDAAAGKEEVLTRRIGNNELAVLRVLGAYVAAQRAYASAGHDGKPPGLYARRFASTPGLHDGLYWRGGHGEPRSPLGVLVAEAAGEGRSVAGGGGPSPFHGYFFRILEGQGASAPGGAKDYVAAGGMPGGFALVAWPVYYDASGIMTFVVGPDGIVHEKDLGPETTAAVARITRYDPDASWHRASAR
jgi:DUF2950 family protein